MDFGDRLQPQQALALALREGLGSSTPGPPPREPRSLPTALVQAARATAFPVIELARAVRFIEVTEIVHAQIVNCPVAPGPRTWPRRWPSSRSAAG